jgi:hypothetical protein
MATARDIVEGSLRLLGVVAQNQPVPDSDAGFALEALQDMLASWSGIELYIPSITTDSFTLVAGTASYTYGTGGTFAASTRPETIQGAYLRNGTDDFPPMRALTLEEYEAIPNKSVSGVPSAYWYNPAYPLGVFYLNYAPDSAYTIKIDVLRALSEPAGLSTSLSFPDQYRACLKFNLAVWLAPEYGRKVSEETAHLAKQTRGAVQARNWRPMNLRCDPTLVGAGRSNIITGD